MYIHVHRPVRRNRYEKPRQFAAFIPCARLKGTNMDQVIDIVDTNQEETIELTLEQLEQVGGGCGVTNVL